MKVNNNTKIIGRNVVLVPYKRIHVPKYHNWMKNEELQRLTASEPLSLEEEFSMRDSWEQDKDKCTFIILDKVTLNETGDEVCAMIGDTNLFLLPDEDYLNTAEAEIMIAEKSVRRQRRGWEAMLLMLRYGCENLAIEKYCAKIGFNNRESLSMFIKMGFQEADRSNVFQEVTLEKVVTPDWREWLEEETKDCTYLMYCSSQ